MTNTSSDHIMWSELFTFGGLTVTTLEKIDKLIHLLFDVEDSLGHAAYQLEHGDDPDGEWNIECYKLEQKRLQLQSKLRKQMSKYMGETE